VLRSSRDASDTPRSGYADFALVFAASALRRAQNLRMPALIRRRAAAENRRFGTTKPLTEGMAPPRPRSGKALKIATRSLSIAINRA
jgi:hypothetical protein